MFIAGHSAIFITGGKIPKAFLPFIPQKIEPQQEVRVLIERQVDQVSEIVANIGLRPQSVVLPPQNKKKLVFFLKKIASSSDS
jgi:hypothetical protein